MSVIDLRTHETLVEDQPRRLVLSPDDEVLYLSLNGENAVVALDAATGQELRRVRTATQPAAWTSLTGFSDSWPTARRLRTPRHSCAFEVGAVDRGCPDAVTNFLERNHRSTLYHPSPSR